MTTTPPHTPLFESAQDVERWLPRLQRLVDEQTDLATSLDRLSQLQSRAVAEADASTALEILGQREPLVARLVEIARDLEPFVVDRDTGQAPVRHLPPETRQSIQRRLTRLSDLMATIARRDQNDKESLEAMRSAIAADLAGVVTGRGALDAYRAAPTPGPQMQDRDA